MTNLSTEQMVGLNGSAFKEGVSVIAWEVVAVVALVLMALWFLPRFLRAGITTVPEYLRYRFGESTGLLCNLLFLAAYMLILLPTILYTGARGMLDILELDSLMGLESEMAQLYAICRPTLGRSSSASTASIKATMRSIDKTERSVS